MISLSNSTPPERRRSMGIEPTSRRLRDSSFGFEDQGIHQNTRFAVRGATTVCGSIEAALEQLVFIEAEQVPDFVKHGDANLFEQFFAVAGKALEVLLE